MALIKKILNHTPQIGEDCFLAENATIIGDVTIGNNCSIWFNTVLRGDVNSIKIGNNVNIQDGVVIHTLYKKSVAILGNNVSIGHNATIHGAEIKENCLIGMGAILLDGVVVESGSIVAAGAVVSPNTHIESGSLYAGIPARKIKDVTLEQGKELIERIANDYSTYASWYK